MGWKRSAPCGASDLAKIRAAFLNKAERLIHGVPIADNPENVRGVIRLLALNSADSL
jgi:hypothetical protein